MSIFISLVQTNIFWEDKSKNLNNIEHLLSKIHHKTDIILLPEMFNSGFTMNVKPLAEKMDGHTVKWLTRMAKKFHSHIMGSLIIHENNQYFNRIVCVSPTEEIDFYDKKHLFVGTGEDKIITAGTERKIFHLHNWRILVQTCFDLRFPLWSFQQQLDYPEYDILINLANWPKIRAHAWKTLLMARAIENQSYVIGVNRIGLDGKNQEHGGGSMVINPIGEPMIEILELERIETVEFKRSELMNFRQKYPFLISGEHFEIKNK